MAVFDITGIDDLVASLSKLANAGEVAPKMLEAGMEILQPAVVAQASRHIDTGAMVASIQPTGVTASGDGYEISTRPTGTDHKGVRNMEKACYIEYGVRGKPAEPMITAAVISCEGQVISTMRNVFESEVGNI